MEDLETTVLLTGNAQNISRMTMETYYGFLMGKKQASLFNLAMTILKMCFILMVIIMNMMVIFL